MDQFLQIIEKNSNLSILIACVVVLISIIIFWLAKQSSSKNKTILITGLSNSGKTTLYSQVYIKFICFYSN
jgi:polynucleotide 5'-kinase involved in rRNA processing